MTIPQKGKKFYKKKGPDYTGNARKKNKCWLKIGKKGRKGYKGRKFGRITRIW